MSNAIKGPKLVNPNRKATVALELGSIAPVTLRLRLQPSKAKDLQIAKQFARA